MAAFLLDARIRQATGGAAALDDLMRLAYRQFAGQRGFTPQEMRATVAGLAGPEVADWLDTVVSSTAELDYAPALDWFGLRFAGPEAGDTDNIWQLIVADPDDQTVRRRRQAWLESKSR